MRLASELHQDASLFARLHGANGYKIADFKPLTQLLFPEVVADYDFVGVCDNDLLLSSELLTSFNSHAWDFDVSSSVANQHRSHGPLQVHRATYYKREIVPLLRGKFLYILLEVFARAGASKATSFDEWVLRPFLDCMLQLQCNHDLDFPKPSRDGGKIWRKDATSLQRTSIHIYPHSQVLATDMVANNGYLGWRE